MAPADLALYATQPIAAEFASPGSRAAAYGGGLAGLRAALTAVLGRPREPPWNDLSSASTPPTSSPATTMLANPTAPSGSPTAGPPTPAPLAPSSSTESKTREGQRRGSRLMAFCGCATGWRGGRPRPDALTGSAPGGNDRRFLGSKHDRRVGEPVFCSRRSDHSPCDKSRLRVLLYGGAGSGGRNGSASVGLLEHAGGESSGRGEAGSRPRPSDAELVGECRERHRLSFNPSVACPGPHSRNSTWEWVVKRGCVGARQK